MNEGVTLEHKGNRRNPPDGEPGKYGSKAGAGRTLA